MFSSFVRLGPSAVGRGSRLIWHVLAPAASSDCYGGGLEVRSGPGAACSDFWTHPGRLSLRGGLSWQRGSPLSGSNYCPTAAPFSGTTVSWGSFSRISVRQRSKLWVNCSSIEIISQNNPEVKNYWVNSLSFSHSCEHKGPPHQPGGLLVCGRGSVVKLQGELFNNKQVFAKSAGQQRHQGHGINIDHYSFHWGSLNVRCVLVLNSLYLVIFISAFEFYTSIHHVMAN